jgi:hypothetical protein
MNEPVSVVQKLHDRIAELEELLGLREQVDMIPLDCCHRKRTQTVIRLLARRELVSPFAIELAIGSETITDSSIRIYVHFARKALREHGITVACDRGRGWYLSARDKARLRALMGDRDRAAA